MGSSTSLIAVGDLEGHVERRTLLGLDGTANSSVLRNFVRGAFTPVLAKHSRNFSIIDSPAGRHHRIPRTRSYSFFICPIDVICLRRFASTVAAVCRGCAHGTQVNAKVGLTVTLSGSIDSQTGTNWE